MSESTSELSSAQVLRIQKVLFRRKCSIDARRSVFIRSIFVVCCSDLRCLRASLCTYSPHVRLQVRRLRLSPMCMLLCYSFWSKNSGSVIQRLSIADPFCRLLRSHVTRVLAVCAVCPAPPEVNHPFISFTTIMGSPGVWREGGGMGGRLQ